MIRPAVILIAVVLDIIIGDPNYKLHPVRLIGHFIGGMESFFIKRCNTTKTMRFAGVLIVLITLLVTGGLVWVIIWALYKVGFIYGFIASAFFSYISLSGSCLAREAGKVKKALSISLDEGRKQVGMIVGRDTQDLGEQEIIKATIETVAENTVDGIISPLIYLFVGGPVLAMCFKGISTIDSMIGYMDEKYVDIGRAGAKVDDVLNFIPARITAILLIVSSYILRFDYKSAFKIVIRDHTNHKSPNCGWPESAVAGALNIQLGGTHHYFGKEVYKPTIGDDIRPAEIKDIKKTNHLMYGAYILGAGFNLLMLTIALI